jgi:hypothetical protein
MSIVFWFQKVQPSLIRIQPHDSHQPLRETFFIMEKIVNTKKKGLGNAHPVLERNV